MSNHYYEDVWEICKMIPEGRVTTYGAIADALALGSARMVGWALKQSATTDVKIPAHRVVNRNGKLSGKMNFETPTLMEDRLKNENISVENDHVLNFEELFWSPLEIIEGES